MVMTQEKQTGKKIVVVSSKGEVQFGSIYEVLGNWGGK